MLQEVVSLLIQVFKQGQMYTENILEKTGTTIKAQAYKDGLWSSIISRYIVN